MNTLLFLLTEASVAMALLYAVYWFFLRKETFFRANRFYLLGALLLSVFLPLFPFRYTVWIEAGSSPTTFEALTEAFRNVKPEETIAQGTSATLSPALLLTMIYLAGAALVFSRLLIQSVKLLKIAFSTKIFKSDDVNLVENNRYLLPFSFFNFVFYNPDIHKQEDLAVILAHERVHIRENHWVDLLFTELLTVVFWFNPFVWLFERSIKQNHEYLADEGVLAQGRSVSRYQTLLINQLMGVPVAGITNHLIFALNATRFKMMTKKKHSKIRAIRLAWALPVVAALLVAFAEPAYQTRTPEQPRTPQPASEQSPKKFTIKGKVVTKSDGKPLHGASVIIQGTSVGTITDANGEFTLVDPHPAEKESPEGQSTILSCNLVISYIGFETLFIQSNVSGSAAPESHLTAELKEGVYHINPETDFKVPPPPAKPKQEKQAAENEMQEVFTVVEQMPAFPGGFYKLGEYIREKKSKEKVLTAGKILVGFTIDEQGKPINIKILKSDNDAARQAAIAIVQGMPAWQPGKQRGKPVPVNYTLPLEF